MRRLLLVLTLLTCPSFLHAQAVVNNQGEQLNMCRIWDGTDVALVDGSGNQMVAGTLTCNAGSGTFSIQATAALPASMRLSDGAAFYDATKTGQLPAALGANGGLKIEGVASGTVVPISGTVTITDGSGAVNVIVDSSALPSGAATSANQDGIIKDGAGDTTQANVTTGRLSVDGSGVTQPVSGTVTVTATNLDVQIGGSDTVTVTDGAGAMNTIVDSGTLTAVTTITNPVQLSDGVDTATVRDVTAAKALDVSIVDGAGAQITSFGGGTQYTEDVAAAADPVGTAPILVRKDTPATTVTTDGDNIAQRGTNFGAAYVTPIDAAGAAVNVAQASTTSGQTGPLVQSATTGSAPIYVTAKTNPLSTDLSGNLRTLTSFHPGTEDTFGRIGIAAPMNQVDVPFYRGTPQALTTVTTTNSGTATSSGGGALFTTSTNANGTSKGVSITAVTYRAGAEIYSYFSARFTTPTAASSFQRIGLYDTNNGFFLGYEGTSFGIVSRKAAADTAVAQASWNVDPLTGGAGSKFTRAGVAEALDPTKINVYRIRFGWLGAAPIMFEVLSPDGLWVTFHQIRQPNLATTLSIENADLPVTINVSKTASDATDLQIFTGCWAAGFSSAASGPVGTSNSDGSCVSVTANTTVLGSFPMRRGATIMAQCDPAACNTDTVFIKLAATATTSDFPLAPGDKFILNGLAVYTGIIDAIANSGTQKVCVMEF